MNGETQTTTTQSQATSAPTQSAPASPPPASDGFSELRRLAAVGAERMGRAIVDNVQGPEGSDGHSLEPEMTLPAGLVNNQFAQQPVQQPVQQQSAQQMQANQPQTQQVATDQPQTQQAEGEQAGADGQDHAEKQALETAKVVLRNAQGQEMAFDNDQLINMIRGYHHYETQIANIQNTYNQQFQQLEATRQQILSEQARIDSLMKSEKGFVLQALETNPEFAEKVANLISENPDLLSGYQNRKVDAVTNQGNEKVAELEQKFNQFLQQQQQAQLQVQQAQQQAYINQTVNTVQANVAQLNQQYQIPPKTIDALAAQAVLEVQTGRLPFDAKAVTGWFENQLKAISLDLAQIKNQVKGQYLQQKQSAPPPPPTGGGAPTPINTAEMSPRERTRFIANQLSQMSNGSIR